MLGGGSMRLGKKGTSMDAQMCPGYLGDLDTREQEVWVPGQEATCRELCSRLLRSWKPQILTYRMKPVSVVIVSPGTTKCFLESRPKFSLRGLRALGSLISNAILAPMTCAGAAPHSRIDSRLPLEKRPMGM